MVLLRCSEVRQSLAVTAKSVCPCDRASLSVVRLSSPHNNTAIVLPLLFGAHTPMTMTFPFRLDDFWRRFFAADVPESPTYRRLQSSDVLQHIAELRPLLAPDEVALPPGLLTAHTLRVFADWMSDVDVVKLKALHDESPLGACEVVARALWKGLAPLVLFVVSELRQVVLQPEGDQPKVVSFSPFAWRNHVRRALMAQQAASQDGQAAAVIATLCAAVRTLFLQFLSRSSPFLHHQSHRLHIHPPVLLRVLSGARRSLSPIVDHRRVGITAATVTGQSATPRWCVSTL